MSVIEYLEDSSLVTADDLEGFFEGWSRPPSRETHLQILQSSYAVVIARDSTRRVIGFGTAISDGILAAYIPLLEVHRELRRQGIGSEIMRRLLARLSDFYMVDPSCDEELAPFYARFKLVKGTAMMRRNHASQSGRLNRQ